MSNRQISRRFVVADQVHSAAIHLLRRLRKSDAALGVSPARLSALSVLVFAGDKSLGELAQAEQVTPPTMSKLVQALEADGLVERRRVAGDKRAILLRATAMGRRALGKGRQMRVEGLAALFRTLTSDDITLLARAAELLERLVR